MSEASGWETTPLQPFPSSPEPSDSQPDPDHILEKEYPSAIAGGAPSTLEDREESPHQPEQSEKPKLQGTDFGDSQTWDEVVRTVLELKKWDVRAAATQILGLPEHTTWEQIEGYIDEQDDIYSARHFGLPENVPQEEIIAHLEEEEDEKFRARARALGLPEDATGSEIHEVERVTKARELGLHEDTPEGEIWRVEKEMKRKAVFAELGIQEEQPWDWEELLGRALCMSGMNTAEAYVKRIREVREWHIERVVKEAELLRGDQQ